MQSCWRHRLAVFLFIIAADSVSRAQVESPQKSLDADLRNAQTVPYCEVLNHPDAFKNKTVRVRAFYETDFERAALTAPDCDAGIPMTWVEFEERWESRTRRRLRHALADQKWRVQVDVVFIGVFKADGHYGHMDMYPFLFEVYKVEAVRASGSFRPLP